MSDTKRRLVVHQNGEMFIEEATLYPTTFPEKILERFANNLTIKIPRVFDLSHDRDIGASLIGGLFSKTQADWLVSLNDLRFRCPVALIEGGKVATPDFSAGKNAPDCVDMFWSPQWNNMYLWFAMSTVKVGEGTYGILDKCYLFVCDYNTNALYRLPTCNVYEDCAICMGTFDHYSTSHIGTLMKCLTQFRISPWNSDLLRSKLKEAQAMFRFVPNEDKEGFRQIPLDLTTAQWQPLCEKVGHTYLGNLYTNLGRAMLSE